MKTIEERALAYSEQVVNDTPFDVINGKVCIWNEDKDICEVAIQAYIKGATEQRKIDIDKTCEWMKDFKTGDGEFPLYNFVGNLRKAMENRN